MQKFPSKICHSSVDFNEEDPEMSPVKTPRKVFSPTQLMKMQLQKKTLEKLPLLNLQAESLHNYSNNSTNSWSSFSSLEERLIENPPNTSPEAKKKANQENSAYFDPKIKIEGSSCLSEKRFQANICKPSLFLKINKQEKNMENLNKKTSENKDFLKPIMEEESPLMKIIRKKKELDKMKNVNWNEGANDKKILRFHEILSPKLSQIDKHKFRNLIFAPEIEENLFKKHLLLTYKGVVYAKKLTQPTNTFLEERGIILTEKKDHKKTLFMDLDETLIHSCNLMENPEIILEIRDDISIKKIGFNVRPYCTKFLEKVSKFFEIYVFTASSELYAKSIISKIDPNNRIQQIFNKNSTMNTKNGFIIKDLRIFQNRNLKEMIIVDNLAHSFSFQLDNGIPLLEWQSDKNDEELKYLYKYLKKVQEYADVRTINKEYLRLMELGELKIEELGL